MSDVSQLCVGDRPLPASDSGHVVEVVNADDARVARCDPAPYIRRESSAPACAFPKSYTTAPPARFIADDRVALDMRVVFDPAQEDCGNQH